MKKLIATIKGPSVFVCISVFLLSACTLFQNGESQKQVAISQAPFIYHAKVDVPTVETSTHYKMGVVLQERHKHRLAVTEFEAAVQQDPDNVAAYNGLGVSLDAMGEYNRAQAAYLGALAIDPHHGDVLNNLGYSYLLQSRYELAVAYFKRALAVDGESARYLKNLGLAYVRLGKDDAAFATFLSAGDEAQAHLNMARICYREGNYDRAALHFSKAANIKPSDRASANGFVAANSLARIHSDAQTQPVRSKGEELAAVADTHAAGYDRDGFATIPAGAIEEPEILDIDQVQMVTLETPADPKSSPPIYMVSLTQANGPEKTRTTDTALEAEYQEKKYETQELKALSATTSASIEKPKRRVRIEVSNGNGVRHMARDVGNYLTAEGFILMYLSNADHFNHIGTSIYYTEGYLDAARRLSTALPGPQTLEEVQVIRNGNAGIRVRIGKDLTNYLSLFQMG